MPSCARVTVKPSIVRRSSRESRIPDSSSMIKILPPVVPILAPKKSITASGMRDLLRLLFARVATRGGIDCLLQPRDRELQMKSSAFSYRTFDADLSAVLLHNPVAHCEPQSCALMLSLARCILCREERIVDLVQMRRVDPAPPV